MRDTMRHRRRLRKNAAHTGRTEFWQQDEAFVRELHELRSAGLVYVREGTTYLPEDLAQAVRQVVGIDMARPAARRLLGYLSNTELHDALVAMGAPSSGSKEERIHRLVAHMTQPKAVLRLRSTSTDRLRDICREVGARSSGSKDELVDRLVQHVASGRDMLKEPEPPPPIQEARALDRHSFSCLFARLRGLELATVLGQFDLRRGGTKETQIATLWEAHRSEETLLGSLSNGDLEGILKRVGLKGGGSKADRINRLVEHFTDAPLQPAPNFDASLAPVAPQSSPTPGEPTPE